MASKYEKDKCYMDVAISHANLSKANRKKVGACIVTQNGVILAGCNGMAPGGSNELEYFTCDNEMVSKPHVIHAELSCLLKAAREGVSVVGGTLYVTMSCCLPCSEMIAAAGINRVVYLEKYRDIYGVINLIDRGIEVVEFMSEYPNATF